MKKRLLTLAIAFLMSIGISGNFATSTTGAQCGAVCAMVCGNRCEGTCYDCTLSECVDKAAVCCDGAAVATGDTGPCPATGPGGGSQ
jgi:hypothetical protein